MTDGEPAPLYLFPSDQDPTLVTSFSLNYFHRASQWVLGIQHMILGGGGGEHNIVHRIHLQKESCSLALTDYLPSVSDEDAEGSALPKATQI